MKKLDEYPFFLDGATGSRLIKAGMPSGHRAELWALDNPGVLTGIQRGYVRAGSNAILAPTFGANRASLKAHGAAGRVRELNLELTGLSREAAEGLALVGGDIAPTGLQTPPAGETDFEELVDIFGEQAMALEEAGVDFFCIETQMSLTEARAAVTAVLGVSEKPVLVSFCTESGKTVYGGDLVAALVTLQDMGIDAFGVNCCGNLELLESLMRKMSSYTELPLIAKPNAGMPEFIGGTAVYAMTPSELGAKTPGFIRAGAKILGGCCGTDERHIEAMREAADGITITPKTGTLTGVVCSSERIVTDLDSDPEIRDLQLTEDVIEEAAEAREDGAELLYVRIRDEEELQILCRNQYGIALPLCVECHDKELLSRFLRVYSGKPVIV